MILNSHLPHVAHVDNLRHLSKQPYGIESHITPLVTTCEMLENNLRVAKAHHGLLLTH